MIKKAIVLIGLIGMVSVPVSSQELTLPGFPLGIGLDVDQSFFSQYDIQLRAVADSLGKYPKSLAIITGGTDGNRYPRYNDALNPSLALGRAQALRNVLVGQYNVDSTQILVQSADAKHKGEVYRYVSIRIIHGQVEIESRLHVLEQKEPLDGRLAELSEKITALEQKPEPRLLIDDLNLHFSGGLSTSPFGPIPIVGGAVSWKKFAFIEGVLGHTFWNSDFDFAGVNLDTRKRMAGGQAVIYPFKNKRIGLLGGWYRFEEISQTFYKYVKLSEGPVFGLRGLATENISITAAYNPSKQLEAGFPLSDTDNDLFLLSLTYFLTIGGGK